MVEVSKPNAEVIQKLLMKRRNRHDIHLLLSCRKALWFCKGAMKAHNEFLMFILAVMNAAYLSYFDFEPAIQFFFVFLFTVLECAATSSFEVYCLAHTQFEPPESWKFTLPQMLEGATERGCPPENVEFLKKLLETTGISQDAGLPSEGAKKHSIEDTRKEFGNVTYGIVEELLEKTGKKAKDIDFLIINCSFFCPTPSLCAMTMNHFGMKHTCQSYNLGGQGCAANVPSTDLAKKLLSQNPNSLALVISTEILSRALYLGKKKSMILANTLFRSGCCAILMSSRPSDVWRSPYKMCQSFRSMLLGKDSLGVIYETQDEEGLWGVHIGRETPNVGAKAMKNNLSMLVPCILPYSELCRLFLAHAPSSPSRMNKFLCSLLTYIGVEIGEFGTIPNLAKGINHFCIHAGGRRILDGIQNALKLTDTHVEPSREVLRKYGNTSSSSIWYELAWLEDNGRIAPGDLTLQVALGSGFKCNTAVWLALK